MRKISMKDLGGLGIEKLSRKSLKNVIGGYEVCPAGFMKCSGCSCHYIDDEGGCGADAGIPVQGVPDCDGVSGLCRISYTYAGEKREYLRDFGTQFSGSHVSGLANSECLSALSNPYINQCSYDCGWDGWGN